MENRTMEEHREVTAVWCPIRNCYTGTEIRKTALGLTEICVSCGRPIRILGTL